MLGALPPNPRLAGAFLFLLLRGVNPPQTPPSYKTFRKSFDQKARQASRCCCLLRAGLRPALLLEKVEQKVGGITPHTPLLFVGEQVHLQIRSVGTPVAALPTNLRRSGYMVVVVFSEAERRPPASPLSFFF